MLCQCQLWPDLFPMLAVPIVRPESIGEHELVSMDVHGLYISTYFHLTSFHDRNDVNGSALCGREAKVQVE